MGLDVGIVNVSYLERPDQPIYDFLWWLAEEVGLGSNDMWGVSWEGNAFVELFRSTMLSKARAYAQKQGLAKDALDTLIAWVEGLPWDGDTVMLHLNW